MLINKVEIGIIGTVLAIMLVVCMFAVITSDNKGPEIRIDENIQISYTEGQDRKILLEGVTAYDEKDGDVTSTIRVESMFVAGDKLKVRYAAKDKHNNVTVTDQFREVAYTAGEGQKPDQSLEGQSGGNGEALQNPEGGDQPVTGENGETPAQPDQPVDSEQQTTGEGETPAGDEQPTEQPVSDATAEINRQAVDQTGIPAIRLTDNEVTISAGTNFYDIGYVAETYDDAGDVSGRVRVEGDFDANKAGDYTLEYFVTDKDGNVSEKKYLKVHVQ